MTRDEIGSLTRHYIFDVLFWPRDERGVPVFDGSDGGFFAKRDDLDEMRDRAIRQGIPYWHAGTFARQRMQDQARPRAKR